MAENSDNQPTLEDFRAFVNEKARQDPDQPINHIDGWSLCAVGQFYLAKVSDREPADWNHFAVPLLGGPDSDLFLALSGAYGDYDYETYGDMAETLKEFDAEGNRG